MKKQLLTIALLLSATFAKAQINLDSNLVLYLPFLGNANDSSGNNNNGIVYGATLTSDETGNANSAYYFDGVSNYIQVANASTLSPVLYTISASVKPQGFWSGTCQGNVILWKGRDTDPGHYGLIFSDNPYDNSCFNFDSLHQNFYNDQGFNLTVGDTPFIQTNSWYCLLSTFDGDSVKMYVDGTLRYTAFRSQVGTNSNPLVIGHNPFVAGYEYWFKGVMDEIRIYNRVLNNAEIDALCGLTNGIAEENNHNSFQIYPNPANNNLTIELSEQNTSNSSIAIINLLGEKLYQQKLSAQTKLNVDVSTFPSGIYIVQLSNEKGITTKRFVKQ